MNGVNQHMPKSPKSGISNWLVISTLSLCCCVGSTSRCQADEKPKAVTVATWNLEWFYDDDRRDNSLGISTEKTAPSLEEWEWKKSAVAKVIAEMNPTIMCLQEVENRKVVYELTKRLKDSHGLRYRYAFIPGYDFGTDQDVAIIYRSGLVEFSRREQSREMFDSQEFYNLSKHLIARFEWGAGDQKESLMLVNVHLRARAEHADLRVRQSRLIRAWVDEQITRGENVIVTGDFNVEEDFGMATKTGAVGILCGQNTAATADDLGDAHAVLPETSRATHISGRQYDRILFSAPMANDQSKKKDFVFNRAMIRRDLVVQGTFDGEKHWDNYYSIPQNERDISDHYPLIVEFLFK